jgi:HEAT repeat protein
VGRPSVRKRVVTGESLFRVGGGGTGNRADDRKPTQQAVETEILPALRWALEPANRLDEDTLAAAHLAIGKCARSEEDVRRLLDTCRRRTAPAMVHECAALSLGLLRRTWPDARFDARLLDQVRGALFTLVDDDALPTRTRCFAALGVGLLGDQGASGSDAMSRSGAEVVRALWRRLEEKHAGEELPVALLVALSLQPPEAVPSGVLEGLKGLATIGQASGRRFGPLARAQAVVALARLSDSTGAGAVLALLRGRGGDGAVRRAAIVSLGISARRLEPSARREAAFALCEAYGRGGDPDTLGVTLVSLGRLLDADERDACTALIDGTPADEVLVRAATAGRAEVRPFAAVALGIAGRGFDRGAGLASAAAFRDRAIAALRESASDERTDPEARGAYCVALGLLEDEGAVGALRTIASRRDLPDGLRGFACLALGLVGRATPEVVATLRSALRERNANDLRRQAAAGLGHLGDASVVPVLLEDLASGGSDHVLARLVFALGQISDARAVPGLVRILKDPTATDLVRAIACAGLGLLGDLEPYASLSRIGADANYLSPTNALHEALSLL